MDLKIKRNLHTIKKVKFISNTKNAIREEKLKNYTRAYNLFLNSQNQCKSELTAIKIISRRAFCLEQVGNHKEAENLILSLTKKYKNFYQSYLLTGLYYGKLKKYKESKKYLIQGLNYFPNVMDLYITLSYTLKDTERWNEAIDVLKKALNIHDLVRSKNGIEKKDIWCELGHLYFDRANYNSCIACLKQALILDNGILACYSTLSRAYLFLDDAGNSIKYLDLQYEKFNFLDTEDYIIKARAHSRLNQIEEAKICITNAYDESGSLFLRSEDMADFSDLLKIGFFSGLENLEIEE